MRAQQIGQDYFLFFDRRGERFSSDYLFSNRIIGGELSDRPERLEAELKDLMGKSLNRKVIVTKRENPKEAGVEIILNSNGDLNVGLGHLAYEHLKFDNELVAPLPSGDGVVRILYAPFKF